MVTVPMKMSIMYECYISLKPSFMIRGVVTLSW